MTPRLALLALLSLVLAACGSESRVPSDSPTPTAVASVQPPTAESAEPASPQPSAPAGGEILSGVLGYDGIEGGCPYLEAGDGTRYQVQYPDGYSIDPGSGDLIGPSGEVVAELGTELQVRGVLRGDLGSTCQIGPIFEAFEVLAS